VKNTTTYTVPLSRREIGEIVSRVVAASDTKYALDLITALQAQKRVSEDTGERLSLDEFLEVANEFQELTMADEDPLDESCQAAYKEVLLARAALKDAKLRVKRAQELYSLIADARFRIRIEGSSVFLSSDKETA